MKLISKIVIDGSTGQPVYKQKSSSASIIEEVASKESLFIMCLVPLKIKVEKTGAIIWFNEQPFSTLLCQPV